MEEAPHITNVTTLTLFMQLFLDGEELISLSNPTFLKTLSDLCGALFMDELTIGSTSLLSIAS